MKPNRLWDASSLGRWANSDGSVDVSSLYRSAAPGAVAGPSQLVDDLAALRPGDKVTLTVTRGSRTLKLTATLDSQPSRPRTG